jgi:hypothetical protein
VVGDDGAEVGTPCALPRPLGSFPPPSHGLRVDQHGHDKVAVAAVDRRRLERCVLTRASQAVILN